MSNTRDPELCSIITNVCKPPKHFDFPEKLSSPLGLFGLKSFHGFVILVGRCLSCVLFGHENVGWQTVAKTFKKHKNVSLFNLLIISCHGN